MTSTVTSSQAGRSGTLLERWLGGALSVVRQADFSCALEPLSPVLSCVVWQHPADGDPDRPRSTAANPALEALSPLVGVWRTTGRHPLVPGTTFHGRTSFEWHEGGAFVLMRSEIDEPQIPSAVAVIGSDDAAGTFTMIYFDERDISRRYAVEVADGEVRWHRDEAGFAPRMVFTVAADGTRLDARGAMSRDGGPWEDDMQLTYERLDS